MIMIKNQIRYIDMKTIYNIFKSDGIKTNNHLISNLKTRICEMSTINYFILQEIKRECIEKILSN
jgi:hypothetical protein